MQHGVLDPQEGWRPVMLSKVDKAPQMTLGEDRLSVTSSKGYRMVRTSDVLSTSGLMLPIYAIR